MYIKKFCETDLKMKRISAFYNALKNSVRRRLFTVFLPVFLLGNVFDA